VSGDGDLDRRVDCLGDPHRRVGAYRALVAAGPAALPAVRRGLRHDDPRVRRQCCRVLDQLVDQASFPDLVAMLGDPAPGVRIETLHALACDRCKSTAWRPSEQDVLPVALRMLREDPNKYVRAMACEVVGRWVHTSAVAEDALLAARDLDLQPSVRKKAGWYAPGGTIHRRTEPRRGRVRSTAP
jgi:HEAT repeat protein